jgi:molecular chaperone DnaK (HSP70)
MWRVTVMRGECAVFRVPVMSWTLAIDFGTTFTSAAIAYDGKIELVEVDGTTRVPSTVVVNEDGHVVVGMAAENQAALDLERVERTPKRNLGEDAPLVLGGRALPVHEAVGAILRMFVEEATKLRGGEPATAPVDRPRASG